MGSLIEAAVPTWPPVPVVHGMLRGWAGVFRTGTGVDVAGVRSVHPWVFYAIGVGAVCERCSLIEKAPDAPSSRGLNGKPEPLFGPQTKDYALFVLSWLNRFSAQHEACREAAAA